MARRSSTGSIRPTAKNFFQTRLTIERANRRLLGAVIHEAEGFAGVLAGFQRGARAVERPGREEFAGPRLGDPDPFTAVSSPPTPGAADVHGRAEVGLLAVELDPAEVGRHPVIVVLGVAFERVVVALGTLDARAEDRLRRGLGDVLGLAVDQEVAAGRLVGQGASGGQDVADELVPGATRRGPARGASGRSRGPPCGRACPGRARGGSGTARPRPSSSNRRTPGSPAGDPPPRPACSGDWSPQEGRRLVARRQRAGQVERDPAQVGRVVRRRRGLQPQLAEPGHRRGRR